MKRTAIAAAIAALTIPVGLAAPAYASNDMTVSVDNSLGTTDMSVYVKVTCTDTTSTSIGSMDAPMVVPAGESRGEVPFCVLPSSSDAAWEFQLDGVFCSGPIINVTSQYLRTAFPYNADGTTVCPDGRIAYFGDTEVTRYFQFEKNNAGVYNLTITTPALLLELDKPLGHVTAATDVNTADTRSKSTNYVTLQPNRVTAMAKRFVASPGSPIDIHAYGPDGTTAMAKAHHVRKHLISEITRLGGDPANYPTHVVYAGDPAHKKGVHVTIHQHAASSVTVPEGGTLTIGGSS